MPYPIVFLDADGTLLDFACAQRGAFFKTFLDLGIPPDEKLLSDYDAINCALWRQLECGEITREQILSERFEQLFRLHGMPFDPVAVSRSYHVNLSQGCDLIDGALDMLRRLFGRCTMAVVTNGIAASQRKRLTDAGILGFFSQVITSEEVGVPKPDFRFFTHALSRCRVTDRSQVLMVGDSLSADIAGGAAAGLATCWFNPSHLPAPASPVPTYRIDDLAQLPGIVLN